MASEGRNMAIGQQEGPSPVIPIIILGIVGMMLSMSSWFEVDPHYMEETLENIQSHFFLGALLIPVCVFLIVQAVGLPNGNNPGQPGTNSYSPIIESVMEDPATSMFLFAVIICLLIAIPFHSYIHAPWQPPQYYERR